MRNGEPGKLIRLLNRYPQPAMDNSRRPLSTFPLGGSSPRSRGGPAARTVVLRPVQTLWPRTLHGSFAYLRRGNGAAKSSVRSAIFIATCAGGCVKLRRSGMIGAGDHDHEKGQASTLRVPSPIPRLRWAGSPHAWCLEMSWRRFPRLMTWYMAPGYWMRNWRGTS